MKRADVLRLRRFQRQLQGFERAISRRLVGFINKNKSEIARLIMASDWDGFHELVSDLKPEFQATITAIFEESGKQAEREL